MGDTQYTASEVESALEEAKWEESYLPYHYDDAGAWVTQDESKRVRYEAEFDYNELRAGQVITTRLGDITVVLEDGGGEGHGEDISMVFRVEDTGQYFKKEGYYASYEGSEWDGEFTEKQAVQRMVTFYE